MGWRPRRCWWRYRMHIGVVSRNIYTLTCVLVVWCLVFDVIGGCIIMMLWICLCWLKVRKTTRRGGWIVFLKTSSFAFWGTVLRFRVWSSSDSKWVQSLCAADKCKEQKKKEHKQLYRFLPQTGSSPVPLALPRRVPLKCNVKLQVSQSHKKETSLCSRTTPRDFYCSITPERDFYAQGQLQETSFAQSQLKETSMLKDNSKRLILTITKNWIRFWILDIQSEVFTIQYETEQTLFF